MRTVGVFDAKTHLSSLIEAVERGESITITKHGRPVARLVPAAEIRRSSVAEALSDLFEFADGLGGEQVDVLELIAEGRRG